MKKEVIQPTGYPRPALHHSLATKAGPFVWTSGLLATDYDKGIHPEAWVDKSMPFHLSQQAAQSAYVFRKLGAIMETAGLSIADIMWCDIPFTMEGLDNKGTTDWSYEDFLEYGVRKYLPRGRPASTGPIVRDLPMSGAFCEPQFWAIKEGGERGDWKRTEFGPDFSVDYGYGRERRQVEGVTMPWAEYKVAVRVGPWVTTAGQIAINFEDITAENIVAKEAQKPTQVWYYNSCKLQAEYILKNIKSGLEQVGSGIENIVYCSVSLENMHDVRALNEVWHRWFPKNPPALRVFPSGIGEGVTGTKGAVVEIETVSYIPEKGEKREQIYSKEVPEPVLHTPHGVKVGNLLFISSQYAADRNGRLPETRSELKYYGLNIKKQQERIFKHFAAICEAAGTSIENITQVSSYYTDLNEMYAAFDVWKQVWPKDPPAALVLGVKPPLMFPECSLMCDAYAIAP